MLFIFTDKPMCRYVELNLGVYFDIYDAWLIYQYTEYVTNAFKAAIHHFIHF